MIDKKKIKRTLSYKDKIQLNFRISPALSVWLRENKYSPRKLFKEACVELGFKEGEGNE